MDYLPYRGAPTCYFLNIKNGARQGARLLIVSFGVADLRGESRVEQSKEVKYVKRSAERARFGGFALAISRQVHDGRGTERH
jgi:hypothetical protein